MQLEPAGLAVEASARKQGSRPGLPAQIQRSSPTKIFSSSFASWTTLRYTAVPRSRRRIAQLSELDCFAVCHTIRLGLLPVRNYARDRLCCKHVWHWSNSYNCQAFDRIVWRCAGSPGWLRVWHGSNSCNCQASDWIVWSRARSSSTASQDNRCWLVWHRGDRYPGSRSHAIVSASPSLFARRGPSPAHHLDQASVRL